MLKKLRIKNYGSHRRFTVKFSPRITCFVGKSYVGKSTILRALKWVMTNKPTGDSFINWDAKTARVSVHTSESKVTRLRGPSKNTYKLDGDVYKAFGNNVPDHIECLFNVGEDNFQKQHDAPFWFSESAGEVNRRLNQIVSLGLIDKTLSNLASLQRQNTVLINDSEQRIKDLKEEKQNLKGIVKAKKEWEALELQHKALQDRQTKCLDLFEILQEIYRQRAIKQPPDIKPLDEAADLYEYSQQECKRLTRIIQQMDDMQYNVDSWNTNAAKIEKKLNKVKRCPVCQSQLKK